MVVDGPEGMDHFSLHETLRSAEDAADSYAAKENEDYGPDYPNPWTKDLDGNWSRLDQLFAIVISEEDVNP